MTSVVIVDDQSTGLKLLSQLVKSIDFHNDVVSVKTSLDTTQALKPKINGIDFIKLFCRMNRGLPYL